MYSDLHSAAWLASIQRTGVMKPPNNLGRHVTIRASGAILNASSSEIEVSPRLGIYRYPDELS